MRIDMTDEERDILIRWKKRSDTYRLVRMKAEAIVYAARGVGLDIIAEMVERAEGRYVSGCQNGGRPGWAPW